MGPVRGPWTGRRQGRSPHQIGGRPGPNPVGRHPQHLQGRRALEDWIVRRRHTPLHTQLDDYRLSALIGHKLDSEPESDPLRVNSIGDALLVFAHSDTPSAAPAQHRRELWRPAVRGFIDVLSGAQRPTHLRVAFVPGSGVRGWPWSYAQSAWSRAGRRSGRAGLATPPSGSTRSGSDTEEGPPPPAAAGGSRKTVGRT